MAMEKAALLSVSDKSGIIEIGRVLQDNGFVLLSTSGTLDTLRKAGLNVVSIADYTGQPEILDGRVKTLHPKIHAGILARRDSTAHIEELKKNKILSIDVVVVNLYPFSETLARKGTDARLSDMVEMIDIGGPTMIRAAAKNISHVTAIIDPADYPLVMADLSSSGVVSSDLRLKLAEKVFRYMAFYNSEIATYLGEREGGDHSSGLILRNAEELRYGENPHQKAWFYRFEGQKSVPWQQLSGKALSYNNYLDLDASLQLVRSLRGFSIDTNGNDKVVALIKHCNPCGLAVDVTIEEALIRAQKCDPRSHFGGIVASNSTISPTFARTMVESFYEIVLAPSFDTEALEILKSKKALRIIEYNRDYREKYEYFSVEGGLLKQEVDDLELKLGSEMTANGVSPDADQLVQLQLAFACVRHVRSNAIVIVKDGQLIGVGAGQMSRVDAASLAVSRAQAHGHDLTGAVAASDAFFPFPDSVEILADAGITAIVAPAGAKKDEEICEVSAKRGVALLFALSRHFRH